MIKKIILGILFIGLGAALVVGAINRTNAKNDDDFQAAAHGQGQNQSAQEVKVGYQGGNRQGAGGQGQGVAQRTSETGRNYPNYQETISDLVTYSGTVIQLPAAGLELILQTDDEELVIGTGPLALADLGLDVQTGDMLEVNGYWEDGEFKAIEITSLASGQSAVLRDGWGHPVWSGSTGNGRGAQGALAEAGGDGNLAPGRSGQGAARAGGGLFAAGEAPGVGQAVVGEWISLQGTISSIDEGALVIELSSGELITIDSRPWRFALEQGFSAAAGDQISITGFYEGDSFETGRLTNLTNGQVTLIREESGRPLWAGKGSNS